MRHNTVYSKMFFSEIEQSTYSSAKALVPVIQKYVSPGSIIDVGCGYGIWLTEWEKAGIHDVIGIDGHYIDKSQLLIPQDKFIPLDLETKFIPNRKFDLVVSLEVAEHLKPQLAKQFIELLCSLGDIILFSAAIPGQGGLQHLNEQYNPYWVSLFESNGFLPYDILRNEIWDNTAIDKCYRQNILFFANSKGAASLKLNTLRTKSPLNIIHPEYFEDKINEVNYYKSILKNPFKILRYYIQAISRRIKF